MEYTIVANEPMQPWLEGLPLDGSHPIPARLRQLLSRGIVSRDGGLYFAAELPTDERLAELGLTDFSTVELEGFINKVSLHNLKPTLRTVPGSNAWVYECLAIAISFGGAILEACAAISPATVEVVASLDFGEDIEYPTGTFRFSSVGADGVAWSRHPDDYEQAVLTIRRGE